MPRRTEESTGWPYESVYHDAMCEIREPWVTSPKGPRRPVLISDCSVEVCGTPIYLAPEIIQCSMDDSHPGYGKEVDM